MTQMTKTVAKLVKALFLRNQKVNSLKDWLKAWLQHVTARVIVICPLWHLCQPTESEKQVMQAKSYISDSFEFQMVKTPDLWQYREFDKSLTSKMGDNHDPLEQVRRFKRQQLSHMILNLEMPPSLKALPLSLGGPQGRYTTHTMLCNSSLVVPK